MCCCVMCRLFCRSRDTLAGDSSSSGGRPRRRRKINRENADLKMEESRSEEEISNREKNNRAGLDCVWLCFFLCFAGGVEGHRRQEEEEKEQICCPPVFTVHGGAWFHAPPMVVARGQTRHHPSSCCCHCSCSRHCSRGPFFFAILGCLCIYLNFYYCSIVICKGNKKEKKECWCVVVCYS